MRPAPVPQCPGGRIRGLDAFIRLVGIENIHGAEHIIGSEKLSRLGSPAIEVLQRILRSGREAGLFHADVDALDVHALISSFCFFRVSNRHTFGALFGRDLVAPAGRDHYRDMLADMICAYLTTPPTHRGTRNPT